MGDIEKSAVLAVLHAERDHLINVLAPRLANRVKRVVYLVDEGKPVSKTGELTHTAAEFETSVGRISALLEMMETAE